MKKLLFFIIGAALFTSCHKDLDRFPTNDVTSEVVYQNTEGYLQAAAKMYGAFALTGNQGPAGNGDIRGIDEGYSDFLRLYWKAQELSTDEAVVAWGDAGIQDFHNMNWSSDNGFLAGLYYRSMYQITLANEFIKQAAPDVVSGRGISGNDAANINDFRNEARFLRAYQYWVLMDLFGNPPFVTEQDVIGSGTLPNQINRADLFNYVESELLELETLLKDARTNEYGRADKGAVWALLARLYLNAQVYTGTSKYTEAITYANKVISAGYSLTGDYHHLMLADNHLNTNEFIFTINYDGTRTQSFGGTTFLAKASVGGDMPSAQFGLNEGWGGIRTTKALVNLFPNANGTGDRRAQFWTAGQSLEIADQTQFSQGYAVIKIRNVKRDNTPGSNTAFSDVDFPLFRLAEQYLIYAEAVLRGGTGGNAGTALDYINQLRTRAGAANIAASQLTLNYVLDERARELYWEGFRRTDLIRYDLFTTATYLWPWKGGVANGRAVESFRNLYPIPSADRSANPTLDQNDGY